MASVMTTIADALNRFAGGAAAGREGQSRVVAAQARSLSIQASVHLEERNDVAKERLIVSEKSLGGPGATRIGASRRRRLQGSVQRMERQLEVLTEDIENSCDGAAAGSSDGGQHLGSGGGSSRRLSGDGNQRTSASAGSIRDSAETETEGRESGSAAPAVDDEEDDGEDGNYNGESVDNAALDNLLNGSPGASPAPDIGMGKQSS